MILKLIRKEILIRKKFLLSVVFYGLIAILASILGGPRLIEVVYIFSIIVFTYFFITTGAEIESKKTLGLFLPACP